MNTIANQCWRELIFVLMWLTKCEYGTTKPENIHWEFCKPGW